MNKRTNFFVKSLYAFIPIHVSNRAVLSVMNILRRLQLRGKAYADAHRDKNERVLGELKRLTPDAFSGRYIENQKSLADLKLGKSNMAYAGCEVIAVYNALKSLNMTHVSLTDLICGFEKDGIIHSGKFGTAVGAMKDHLNRYGLKTVMTYKKDLMGKLMDESHTSILTIYNDRSTIGAQIHTVCITRDDADDPALKGSVSERESEVKAHAFYVHNMHGDGRVFGPYKDYESMMDHLNDGRSMAISLIGIDLQ